MMRVRVLVKGRGETLLPLTPSLKQDVVGSALADSFEDRMSPKAKSLP